MTPKTEFFGRIEDYCLDELDAQDRLEFEKELEINQELRDEVELQKNIQAAIMELDIIELKGKLEDLQTHSKPDIISDEAFELLDDLTDFEELSDELTSEELINNFEALPKVHVYQHERTSSENTHQFYKEQNSVEANGFDEDLNGLDMEGLEGLEEAILEKDILDLRDTLKHVSKSVESQYSVEEIDNFLSGELDDDILSEFETELDLNEDLQAEVDLHRDIENAIHENDVMNLRSRMSGIMESETSWNVSESGIEEYIDGTLDEELRKEFEAELNVNTDLSAEVAMRRQINEAVGEVDIMDLRVALEQANDAVETNETISIMPRTDFVSKRFLRNTAAMIIVLIGLAGVLNTSMYSLNEVYNNNFESPTWATERSVSSNIDIIQTSKIYYQEGEYKKAVDLLESADVVENEAFVSQFYIGLSYQNLQEFDKAIKEYAKIIEHGNNLFIEEAEWYKTLCYLRMNKKKEAKHELLAVIDRKGHYEKDAKAILRRLRYSFK